MRHHIVEIISSDKPVIIEISLSEHYINFLVGHILAEILGHFFEFG